MEHATQVTSPGEKCQRSASSVRREPAKSLLRNGAELPPGLCCVLDQRAYEAHYADTGHDLEDSSPHAVSILADRSRGTADAASLTAWPQADGALPPSYHAPTPGAGKHSLLCTILVLDSPCRKDSGGICVWTCLTQGYTRANCWGSKLGPLGSSRAPTDAQRIQKQPLSSQANASIAHKATKAVMVASESTAKGCLDTSSTLATIHSSTFKIVSLSTLEAKWRIINIFSISC